MPSSANIFRQSWIQLNQCPKDEGRNLWIIRAARAFSVFPDWKIHEIIENNLTRKPRHDEIEHAIRTVRGSAAKPSSSPSIAAVYAPQSLAQTVADVPVIDETWLAKASPIGNLAAITPSEYLDMVFLAGDKSCVSISDYDKGFIYPIGDSKIATRLNNYVKCNENGSWFSSQPVNGTPIDGKLRSGANLVAFRHILLESDIKGIEPCG
jgi:hypothetical protein